MIRRRVLLPAFLILALVAPLGPIGIPRVNAQTCGVGGGTTSNSVASSGDFGAMGTSSGTAYEAAQQFQVAAGTLTEIKFRLDANSGTPTGTLTWEITQNNAGQPGTVLQTSTISPTASAVNTITVGSGVSLSAGTPYWLRLYPTSAQSSPNYWTWRRGPDTYADGVAADRIAGTWSQQSTKDLDFSITTAPPACTDTPTPTPTNTPTNTFTPSNTPTDTPTFTPTFTDTVGPSPTSPTDTPTPTPTFTATATDTPTQTFTPSATFTASVTPLYTFTPNLYGIVTLPSDGRAGAIVYTVSIGESVIISEMFVMLVLCMFGLFFLLRKARG